MIWVLLLFIVSPVETNISFIHTYSSQSACETEMKRIAGEFAKAYPNDNSYYFDCKLVEKKKKRILATQ